MGPNVIAVKQAMIGQLKSAPALRKSPRVTVLYSFSGAQVDEQLIYGGDATFTREDVQARHPDTARRPRNEEVLTDLVIAVRAVGGDVERADTRVHTLAAVIDELFADAHNLGGKTAGFSYGGIRSGALTGPIDDGGATSKLALKIAFRSLYLT